MSLCTNQRKLQLAWIYVFKITKYTEYEPKICTIVILFHTVHCLGLAASGWDNRIMETRVSKYLGPAFTGGCLKPMTWAGSLWAGNPCRGSDPLFCAGSFLQGAGTLWWWLQSTGFGWQSLAEAGKLLWGLEITGDGFYTVFGWQPLAWAGNNCKGFNPLAWAGNHWLGLVTTGKEWRPLS